MIAYVEDRLPAEPRAVPLARHALAVALITEVPDEVLDTILLLTTEAVSAALRATEEPWQLRVEVHDTTVRVTVRFQPAAPVDDEYAELQNLLFDGLSRAWGADATSVWFEVDRHRATLVA